MKISSRENLSSHHSCGKICTFYTWVKESSFRAWVSESFSKWSECRNSVCYKSVSRLPMILPSRQRLWQKGITKWKSKEGLVRKRCRPGSVSYTEHRAIFTEVWQWTDSNKKKIMSWSAFQIFPCGYLSNCADWLGAAIRAKYRTRAIQQEASKRWDSVPLAPFLALVWFPFLLPLGAMANPGILSQHIHSCLLGSQKGKLNRISCEIVFPVKWNMKKIGGSPLTNLT